MNNEDQPYFVKAIQIIIAERKLYGIPRTPKVFTKQEF